MIVVFFFQENCELNNYHEIRFRIAADIFFDNYTGCGSVSWKS